MSLQVKEEYKNIYDDQWETFKTYNRRFQQTLDNLLEESNLREKATEFDAAISSLKIYESYLAASKIPISSQQELFSELIKTMGLTEYTDKDIEELYKSLSNNTDNLRENMKLAIAPNSNYAAGMFWTLLVVASNEINDYHYLKCLADYHIKYLVALAGIAQCFTNNPIIDDITVSYCEQTHSLLALFLKDKNMQ